IGEVVMTLLPAIDEIAYVRYASVYRSFEDVAAFSKEIDKLRKKKTQGSNVAQLSLLNDPASRSRR
ncbi:MAG: transcriptional regulator NrdR, partial [Gammaproteobacteria bacterium]